MSLASASLRAAAVLALSALGTGVLAQNYLGIRAVDLTQEDYDYLGAAAQKLYTAEAPAVGDTETWENPASGALGQVEIIAVQEDGRCLLLRHFFRPKPSSDVAQHEVRRCKAQDGSWKLAPE